MVSEEQQNLHFMALGKIYFPDKLSRKLLVRDVRTLNAENNQRNGNGIIWVYLLVKLCSCKFLRFGTAGWAWPNRSEIVTHGGSSSSSYEFDFSETLVSEKSPFSLEWGWCCLQHPQAGQQNLLLLRLYWFQKKKITVVQWFCLCSFTFCGLGCRAPALPRDIPLMSPAWHRVSVLSEIVSLPNRAQILMWKRQPTLENSLTHF